METHWQLFKSTQQSPENKKQLAPHGSALDQTGLPGHVSKEPFCSSPL